MIATILYLALMAAVLTQYALGWTRRASFLTVQRNVTFLWAAALGIALYQTHWFNLAICAAMVPFSVFFWRKARSDA